MYEVAIVSFVPKLSNLGLVIGRPFCERTLSKNRFILRMFLNTNLISNKENREAANLPLDASDDSKCNRAKCGACLEEMCVIAKYNSYDCLELW